MNKLPSNTKTTIKSITTFKSQIKIMLRLSMTFLIIRILTIRNPNQIMLQSMNKISKKLKLKRISTHKFNPIAAQIGVPYFNKKMNIINKV